MKQLLKPLFFSAILLAAGAAQAQPQPQPLALDVAHMDAVFKQSRQEIQLARRHSRGRWVAPLVAGAVIGAMIANQSSASPNYRPRHGGDGYPAAKRRCASEYRSYDWKSDTFVTYGGVVKLCPYVRPYYR